VSQYPSPYLPPQLPYTSAPAPEGPAPAGPARKAAILLFVLGGLGAAMGLCMGSLIWVVPSESPQMQKLVEQLVRTQQIPPLGISADRLVRITYTVLGLISIAIGIVLVVLGFFVRRAGKAATVTATILCGLATLYVTVNVLVAGRLGLAGDTMALLGGCLALVPLSLFGLATLWLVQLLRALPGIQAARRQYRSQFNQSQHQQWQYNSNQPGGMPGYGGYAPPVGPGQMPVAPPSGQGYAMPPQVPPATAPAQNPKPESPKPESSPNDKMPE
jgi:hypothetical protein